MATHYRNEILRRCEPETLDRLAIRKLSLPVRREIEFPGKLIRNLFFLEGGVASMTTTFHDGFEVEVALAGYEGVLGASVLLGTRRSLNRVYMQISGSGYVTEVAAAMREFQRGGRFQNLVLAHQQAQFVQTAQTVACNTRHTTEQRFSRWILLCADRVESDILPLKQEFIGDMLGVTRSSVSIAVSTLQAAGFIHSGRGQIRILDRPGLLAFTCECYEVVRDHLTSYADLGEAAVPKEKAGN